MRHVRALLLRSGKREFVGLSGRQVLIGHVRQHDVGNVESRLAPLSLPGEAAGGTPGGAGLHPRDELVELFRAMRETRVAPCRRPRPDRENCSSGRPATADAAAGRAATSSATRRRPGRCTCRGVAPESSARPRASCGGAAGRAAFPFRRPPESDCGPSRRKMFSGYS